MHHFTNVLLAFSFVGCAQILRSCTHFVQGHRMVPPPEPERETFNTALRRRRRRGGANERSVAY